jgi:hypothetical protein
MEGVANHDTLRYDYLTYYQLVAIFSKSEFKSVVIAYNFLPR